MNDFPIPTDTALNQVRTTYAALSAAQSLIDDNTQATSVAAHQVFAYATGATAYPNAELERHLHQNPGMRATHRRMMSARAVVSLGMAMAASDGDLLPRSGDGCTIRFEKSKAEQGAYYVIIELTGDTDRRPSHLVVCDEDDTCQQFALPQARRGIIQILVAADAELLDLLRKPNTEVFLR